MNKNLLLMWLMLDEPCEDEKTVVVAPVVWHERDGRFHATNLDNTDSWELFHIVLSMPDDVQKKLMADGTVRRSGDEYYVGRDSIVGDRFRKLVKDKGYKLIYKTYVK